MKKSILALPAALALCIGAPATLNAQQQTTEQVTLGDLIAALNNITVNIDNLQALNDLSVADVRVVNVEDVLNDNNVEAVNDALNRNELDILTLRNVLNGLTIQNVDVLRSAPQNFLNQNGVGVTLTDSINDNVVAIDAPSGGDVVVFSQPQ